MTMLVYSLYETFYDSHNDVFFTFTVCRGGPNVDAITYRNKHRIHAPRG